MDKGREEERVKIVEALRRQGVPEAIIEKALKDIKEYKNLHFLKTTSISRYACCLCVYDSSAGIMTIDRHCRLDRQSQMPEHVGHDKDELGMTGEKPE